MFLVQERKLEAIAHCENSLRSVTLRVEHPTPSLEPYERLKHANYVETYCRNFSTYRKDTKEQYSLVKEF